MKLSRWTPASVRAFQDYSLATFAHDLGAGVTVGLVALPLAMAFAIASGLTPQAGIYCAIVTGFLISLLGGSRYQIGGPTGAFVVVVAGIVAEYGVSGLYMVTMMAGVMLVILGVTGMGAAVKYLPRPVVIGFTNGIAVLIASTQIRDFFGLQMAAVPSEFAERMQALAHAAGTISLPATVLAVASLAVHDRAAQNGAPRSRYDHRAGRGHRGGGGVRARRGDDRVPLRRHSRWTSGAALPGLRGRTHPGAAPSRADGRHARRHRVIDVGGRRRPDGQRPAQPERRADRAGRRQHRLADFRRAAGDRRDRANRDEHPLRRPHPGGRNDARGHAAGRAPRRRAAGELHPDGGARRDPLRRRLQHGRVARDPAAAEADEDRHQRVARDLRADGFRGPDAGGRGRDDPGGAALHPPGRNDDDGLDGDLGLHRVRAARTACRTRPSRPTSPSSGSTARCCSASPTSWP